VALMSPQYAFKQYTTTSQDGAFQFSEAEKGHLIAIQPPTLRNEQGVYSFSIQPRIYVVGDSPAATLRLPPSGCLVLKAYDADGRLMRYEDYIRKGTYSGQFAYLTNLEGEMRPPSAWWVHDDVSAGANAKRENGLPAFAVEPGASYVVHLLFWEVPSYMKLWLRADNGGQGFPVSAPGECIILEVNAELARTAVAQLVRRSERFGPDAKERIAAVEVSLNEALGNSEPAKRAKRADETLLAALRLRDQLELDAARSSIPAVRKGKLRLNVEGTKGACKVRLAQRSHDFLFGVYEGSPYNAAAYESARKAGFDMATVLLGWNWTEPQSSRPSRSQVQLGNETTWSMIDGVFGVGALKKLGYKVKAHGVIYLQDYGILPDKALKMGAPDLPPAILSQQRALLESPLGGEIDLWEAMNEPGCTNIVNLPRDVILSIVRAAARNVKEVSSKPTLINSAHETNFGAKYMMYTTDNEPVDNYPITYSEFLRQASDAGVLNDVDIIGLQVYPGFRLSAMLGGREGPAFTPASILDLIDLYSRFGKPLHITEFSVPSTCPSTWQYRVWSEKWDEAAQAGYADAVYTLAFSHPQVHSITWWGISDLKPDVETGSLLDPSGKPRPVLERLQQRIAEWTTNIETQTAEDGALTVDGFAGDYDLTVIPETGSPMTQSVHLREREETIITVSLGKKP
jgi:hypothetical protein